MLQCRPAPSAHVQPAIVLRFRSLICFFFYFFSICIEWPHLWFYWFWWKDGSGAGGASELNKSNFSFHPLAEAQWDAQQWNFLFFCASKRHSERKWENRCAQWDRKVSWKQFLCSQIDEQRIRVKELIAQTLHISTHIKWKVHAREKLQQLKKKRKKKQQAGNWNANWGEFIATWELGRKIAFIMLVARLRRSNLFAGDIKEINQRHSTRLLLNNRRSFAKERSAGFQRAWWELLGI